MKKYRNSKKRKGFNMQAMRCPYCGGKVIFRSADGIYNENKYGTMLYVCSHYPQCDSYVRASKNSNIPVGTMANAKLRRLRTEAHREFDQLYKTGRMDRNSAYKWLADLIGAPLSKAHIGLLGEYYCTEVIKQAKKLLDKAA